MTAASLIPTVAGLALLVGGWSAIFILRARLHREGPKQ